MSKKLCLELSAILTVIIISNDVRGFSDATVNSSVLKLSPHGRLATGSRSLHKLVPRFMMDLYQSALVHEGLVINNQRIETVRSIRAIISK